MVCENCRLFIRGIAIEQLVRFLEDRENQRVEPVLLGKGSRDALARLFAQTLHTAMGLAALLQVARGNADSCPGECELNPRFHTRGEPDPEIKAIQTSATPAPPTTTPVERSAEIPVHEVYVSCSCIRGGFDAQVQVNGGTASEAIRIVLTNTDPCEACGAVRCSIGPPARIKHIDTSD